jgi:cytochrome b6-f complex iron-sulfur subunit
VIRSRPLDARLGRRQALRLGFLGVAGLATAELSGLVAPFLRVTRVEGLGTPIAVGTAVGLLEAFAKTDDRPILNYAGRFFLLRAPGGIVAAYRKCTHLGCTVPFNAAEDRFHCVCHQSVYDKHTALLLGGPAPRGLDLFHMRDVEGTLIVDTNPLNVMVRADNHWDPAHVEISA